MVADPKTRCRAGPNRRACPVGLAPVAVIATLASRHRDRNRAPLFARRGWQLPAPN